MAIFSAIGYAFAYAASFLAASVGLSASTAVAIGTSVGQAAMAGAAMLINRALTPKVNVPQSDIQAVITQADAQRRVHVGENLVGGIRAFFDVKDAVLYQLVVTNHGRINSFKQFRIDGEPAPVSDMGAITSGPTAGSVWVATRDGSGIGGDYPSLAEKFPTLWPASRRLQGQATFLVTARARGAEDFPKVFPKGSNTLYQWVIEGALVYDPRTGATVYSDNAALVIAYYLTHPDGYRLDHSEVDWDSVAAMADWCDLPIAQRAGGAAPNMRLWGYWTLDEDPKQVLDRMAASCGIRPYEMQNGKIGLIGGPFGTPACTLTHKDISDIQTREAISEREGYNTLRVFHMAAEANYTVSEVDIWSDPDRLAQEGEIAEEMRLEMCPNTSQARRRAKRQMHDDNRGKVEIITNLVGFKARYPKKHGQRHTIMLDYRPQDGSGRIIAGEYEVLDHEVDPQGLQCRIDLARVDRASEAWNPDTEEGDPPASAVNGANNPPPPIEAVLSQRVIDSGGGLIASLEVAALPITDRDDLRVQGRYRQVGETAWISMQGTGLIARSGPVADRTEYEAQVRWQGVFKGVDEWQGIGPITVIANSVAPGRPSELIPSVSGGAVHLSWRNPAGSFDSIRIKRGTTTNYAAATLVDTTGGVAGQISEGKDATGNTGTLYRYWVVAANSSGLEGDPFGPVQITAP
ncbi:hypothetical protein [Paracoccus fontiphilus]|uniref:Fibronectin type-III domain-containing protein n=1 Tax=Paracoccus fontiphilus TaxID=1815556 RepID=A0ABV7IF15_9RHOB|nr:hypothetical protein [Paracoccus fontiphilus]